MTACPEARGNDSASGWGASERLWDWLQTAWRTGYPARAAKGEGDVVPSIEVWRRPRQMQDEAADRAADFNAEFEQPVCASHVTWVRAQAVRAARKRSSCMST